MPNLLRCPLQCCAKLIELEERYTFTVTERDYDASFRCEVTVLDEAYLEQCAAILAEQGVELTEEQRTAEQKLYSVVMSVESGEKEALVPFPVSWTVKMKKKQKETQDILSYHTQAAGCSDKARAKASGGRQPIEECGRTGL